MSTTVPALRFKNKVAIVTGGVRGIGRGIVDVLVENGGNVVVFDIQELYTSSGKTVRKNNLVISVGFHPGSYTIDELSVQGFKDLLQLNLISYFTASKYALPNLRKSKGNIVNITSIASAAAFRNSVTYVATKGGITSFTKALAIDEAKHGVRVNAIAPGAVDAPRLKEVWPADELEKLKTCHVLQKFAEPREIDLACLCLAVDATFTTVES